MIMERKDVIENLAKCFEPIMDDLEDIGEPEPSIQPDEANVNEEAGASIDLNCTEMCIRESNESSPTSSFCEELEDILKNSANMDLQLENSTPIFADKDCYFYSRANQFDPPQNGINYSAGPSTDLFCADLPLHDPKTLRFFYNIGLDYFHAINAAHNYCYLPHSNIPVAEQNPVPTQNYGCENNFENSDGENAAAENAEQFENDEGERNMRRNNAS